MAVAPRSTWSPSNSSSANETLFPPFPLKKPSCCPESASLAAACAAYASSAAERVYAKRSFCPRNALTPPAQAARSAAFVLPRVFARCASGVVGDRGAAVVARGGARRACVAVRLDRRRRRDDGAGCLRVVRAPRAGVMVRDRGRCQSLLLRWRRTAVLSARSAGIPSTGRTPRRSRRPGLRSRKRSRGGGVERGDRPGVA